MSRKPPSSTTTSSSLTTGRSAGPISRQPSSSTLTSMMPPPARIPTTASSRSHSAATTSHNEVNGRRATPSNNGDAASSRSNSPSRGESSSAKRTVASSASTKSMMDRSKEVNENGEINIQVVVRCRGRSALEQQQRSPNIITTTGPVSNNITIETSTLASSSAMAGIPITSLAYSSHVPVSKTYNFDRVFGPEADQTCVYKEVVEGMLDEVLSGYNCTIFAYGQTGTGKTYTMQGDLSLTPLQTPTSDAGIIPRVLHRLFTLLEATPNSEYSVKCSYVELYNEELRDLLAADFKDPAGSAQPMALMAGGSSGAPGGLKIYEDQNKRGGVMIQGLEEASIRNASEALALLLKGTQRRQVAETKMNSESSRSHSIFSLTVHLKETSAGHAGEDLLKVGKLNLVDLAGSEAIGRSGAVEKRAREAGMINQSLLTLGRVISALVDKSSHIPYRESKLTRLLQDSLGGRTKTCIVATVSPTKSNLEETLSTLDYALRARTIRNKPEVNQRMTKGSLIKEYVIELERLKQDLAAAREKNGVFLTAESWEEMQTEQAERKSQLEDALQAASTFEQKHATLAAEFDTNMKLLIVRDEELKVIKQDVVELKEMIQQLRDHLEGVRIELAEEKIVSETYRRGEEKLHRVATGLKGTVEESVKDVGGLFAKIARKADVLSNNTAVANSHSSELERVTDQLRRDIDSLRRLQSEFGGTLQTELQAFAKRGAKTLEQDKFFLDQRLSSFSAELDAFENDLATSHSSGQANCLSIERMKQDLQRDLNAWMTEVRVSCQKQTEGVLEKHKSLMKSVSTSTEELAGVLDVVIAGALEKTESDLAATQAMAAMSKAATAQEMSRLQAQNQRLADLLVKERTNNARLRDNMISQITSLLTSFTTQQDDSLTLAIDACKQDNEQGMSHLLRHEVAYSTSLEEFNSGSAEYVQEMESTVKKSAKEQTDSSQRVIAQASEELAKVAQEDLASTNKALEDGSTLLEGGISLLQSAIDTESSRQQAAQSAQAQSAKKLGSRVAETYSAAKDKLVVAKEDIKAVSSAVLASHAATEPVFANHCASTSSKLDAMQQSNKDFVAGIRHDLATGSTPRKKTWSVPSRLQLQPTGARDVILQQHRLRRVEGVSEPDETSFIEMEELVSSPRNATADKIGTLNGPEGSPELQNSSAVSSASSLEHEMSFEPFEATSTPPLPHSPVVMDQENIAPSAPNPAASEPHPLDVVKPIHPLSRSTNGGTSIPLNKSRTGTGIARLAGPATTVRQKGDEATIAAEGTRRNRRVV